MEKQCGNQWNQATKIVFVVGDFMIKLGQKIFRHNKVKI